MRNISGAVALAVVSLAISGGCGRERGDSEPGGAAGDLTGLVELDLTLAPTDVRCVVVTVEPAMGPPVRRSITVVPAQSTVFSLTGLPIGVVTFSERAFDVPCSGISGHSETWVSDSVTVTLQAGTPVRVALTLRRVNARGEATVISNFPDAKATSQVFRVGGSPNAITTGPDGALWFADAGQAEVGRITTTGSVTRFPASPGYYPVAITAGPDGAIWFSQGSHADFSTRLAKMTTDGVLTSFPLANFQATPSSLAVGADGNLWFEEWIPNIIGKITPSGMITELAVPTPDAAPAAVSAGPDGNIWFTESAVQKLGRVTPDGTITEIAISTANQRLGDITTGPDGNIWFIAHEPEQIVRMSPAGAFSFYSLPSPTGFLIAIAAGPDGNVWYADAVTSKIGRITPLGAITELVPAGDVTPGVSDITAGPDGNIWYVDANDGNVVRINL